MDSARPTRVTDLETPRLVLERLSVVHAPEMFDALRDPELYSLLPLDPPESMRAVTERYKRLERGFPQSEDEVWLNWIVRDRVSGAAIGHVQATVYEDMTCDLFYMLALPAQGHGFATEACQVVIDELRRVHHVGRVEVRLDNRNVRAAMVADRLGFELDRVEDSLDYHTGQPTQEVILVLEDRSN